MGLAAGFVLLSQWQFSQSRPTPPPPPTATEEVLPLTSVFAPGTAMTASVADQMVRMEGHFVQDTRLLVQNRMQAEREGFWIISAFAVSPAAAGAAGDATGDGTGDGTGPADGGMTVIPIVLGWVPDADAADALGEPEGAAVVVGRLLPTEAPVPEQPVSGQVRSLSAAELTNLWDLPTYAGFVVPTSTTVDGAAVAPVAPVEAVAVGPQPQDTPVNWLNIFYAAEWAVFAGFAFFLWWRLVADDHRREGEDAADAAAGLAQPPPSAKVTT